MIVYPEPIITKSSKVAIVKLTHAQKVAQSRRIAAQITRMMQISFKEGIRIFRDTITMKEVSKSLKRGDLRAVNKLMNWERWDRSLAGLRDDALEAMRLSSKAAEKALPKVLRPRFRFDLTNPRIYQWIERETGKRITRIGIDSMKAVRALARRAVKAIKERGIPPARAAKQLIEYVGPHVRQAQALINFENRLIARGFDPADIARQVDAYRKKLIIYRGKMIAKTEAFNAVNAGQHEAWNQMADQKLIDREKSKKRWSAGPGACEHCSAMDGVAVPLNDPWITPDGKAVMLPAEIHPNCSCTMSLEPKYIGV